MNRKKLSLILAGVIPVVIVVILISVVYLPRYFAPEPGYDFYFADHDEVNPYCDYSYELSRDEKLPEKIQQMCDSGVRILRYDVRRNEAEKVNCAKFDRQLITSSESPDGWQVKAGREVDSHLFFAHTDKDYDRKVLQGHNSAIKLNIEPEVAEDFLFLGWVKTNGQN